LEDFFKALLNGKHPLPYPMTMGFVIEECKRRAALNATPMKKLEFSFDKIADSFPALASSRHVLVIEIEDKDTKTEVIVHREGKLIFKKCHDRALAKRLAERIYTAGAQ